MKGTAEKWWEENAHKFGQADYDYSRYLEVVEAAWAAAITQPAGPGGRNSVEAAMDLSAKLYATLNRYERALRTIKDECFSGYAYDIAADALNAAPQSEGARDAGLPDAGQSEPADAALSPGRPAAVAAAYRSALTYAASICDAKVLDRENPFDNGCWSCAEAIRHAGDSSAHLGVKVLCTGGDVTEYRCMFLQVPEDFPIVAATEYIITPLAATTSPIEKENT